MGNMKRSQLDGSQMFQNPVNTRVLRLISQQAFPKWLPQDISSQQAEGLTHVQTTAP